MIRRSTVIATVAVVMSLLVHFLGLSFTSGIQPERPTADAPADTVAMGNAFEDVVDTVSEPVEPEPAPVPEPPVEATPEPEPADIPTSEALVASDNPQPSVTPDESAARSVQPDTIEPTEPSQGEATDPSTVEPLRGQETPTVEAEVTPPVKADTIAQAPKGEPDAGAEPVAPAEAVTAEPALSAPVAAAPQPDAAQQLAALPAPLTPAVPVTPAPVPSVVPVVPLQSQTVDPVTPQTTLEATPEVPDAPETEEEIGGSDLAVNSSPRPRLASRSPSALPLGQPEGETALSDTPSTQRVESPIAAYKRDGTDLTFRQNGGTGSSGLSFLDFGSSGNSSTTNYAGQVLVHLNRVPAVRVAARGFARVFFQINPDGSLASVSVIDSSGSQEINRAATAQVRSAAPFPRPPNGASRKLAFVYRSN